MLSGPVVPALRIACERDHGTDERVTPPLDVCDASVAKLAVAKRLADRSDVDSQAPLLDGDVGPDMIHQLLLCDHHTRTLDKVEQDVERPAAKGQYHTIAPKYSLANRKFERTESQLPVNRGAMHVSPKRRFPRVLYAASRQTPQLYERKAGRNEARNELKPWYSAITSTPKIGPNAIQSGLNAIQEVALIERLGQIADDPSLKCAGTNIIARIGSYHYGGNLFAQSRQIVVQIKASHLGHVEVDNQAAGAVQFG